MLPSILVLLADQNETFWFPPKASSFAKEIDWLFMAILWISIFFFVVIVAAMIYCVVKFRRRPGYKGDSSALHNNTLEIAWTVVPTIIACWIFAQGVVGYNDMMSPPVDTIDINVTARKWDWSFQYPNGAISDTLHVPNERAVRLRMRSEDVLHAFYVPAFRAKTDIVPGRVNIMWFKPIREGTYDLFCAEYCGDQHSEMIKRQGVFVHSQEGYDAWLAEAAKAPVNPVAHGYWLYERMGCKSCHSVKDGVKVVGPSFAKSYGTQFKGTQGEDIVFDENYIRESILNPQAKMREGYQNASQMPSFQGKLKEDELIALSAFLEWMAKDEFIAAVEDGELSDDDKVSLGIQDPTEADGETPADPSPESAADEEPAGDN